MFCGLRELEVACFKSQMLLYFSVPCRSRIIITSTGAMRGSKPVDLKGIVDEAVAACTKNGHRVSKTM